MNNLALRLAFLKRSRLVRFIADICRWLGEGKIVFVPVGGVILVVIPLFLFGLCSEAFIRVIGLVLQVLGMVIAFNGLRAVRTHFRQPPLREVFFIWWWRRPKWKRSLVIGAGTIEGVSVVGRARLEVWSPDNPDQPIEERIAGIVKNLDRIRESLREHGKSIESLSDGLDEQKKNVEESMQKLEERTRLDSESLHTSDLGWSLVSLVWLAVGIVMSTLAPELSKWVQCR